MVTSLYTTLGSGITRFAASTKPLDISTDSSDFDLLGFLRAEAEDGLLFPQFTNSAEIAILMSYPRLGRDRFFPKGGPTSPPMTHRAGPEAKTRAVLADQAP